MKILFTRFPLESTLGGAEIQTLSLMEGLRAAGHDVSFLGSCPTLLRECRKRDIAVTELNIGGPPVTKTGALTFLWRKGKMKQALIKELAARSPQPAAVFMLSLSEKILVTDALVTKGTKVFWIEHDRIGKWLTANPWLKTLRRLSKKATTVCVSQLSRRLYLDLGWPKEKIVAIPNGIDLKKFSAEKKTGNPVPRVGCIARLSAEKGVEVLIDAVAPLLGVTTTIVGTGKEEEKLRDRMRKLSLRDRIEITSSVSDIPAFYRSIDLFVLPSKDHDPFGLVAAEAMASGVATIVTEACGIAGELRSGTDALIVRAGDAKQLQLAISELSTNAAKRERIAEAGKKTAREKFSAEKMVARYLDLFA